MDDVVGGDEVAPGPETGIGEQEEGSFVENMELTKIQALESLRLYASPGSFDPV